MKAMVVYDTVHGNTRAIAEAIAGALPGRVVALVPGAVALEELAGVDLLVIGSPTHGGLPTEAMRGLLARIGPPRRGGRVAAFDTRLTWPMIARLGRFAAEAIALDLSGKGWEPAVSPQGFYVSGLFRWRLKPGQPEKASAWARAVVRSLERE